MMPTAALVIWTVTLLVVAFVVVPLAVGVLRRTVSAAWATERYLADMERAGRSIAGHTGSVPALDGTVATANYMAGVARDIEAKTGAVKDVLAARAEVRP